MKVNGTRIVSEEVDVDPLEVAKMLFESRIRRLFGFRGVWLASALEHGIIFDGQNEIKLHFGEHYRDGKRAYSYIQTNGELHVATDEQIRIYRLYRDMVDDMKELNKED